MFGGGYDGDLNSKVDSLSLRSPLRKLFVESASESASESDELERIPTDTYCEWSGAAAGGAKAVEASPEICKKSNSTGFSKLWRFRDLVHRSNNDGKERGLAYGTGAVWFKPLHMCFFIFLTSVIVCSS